MDDALAGAFADASRFLVEAVGLVPATAWDQPGLDRWTLRELAGHANRSHWLVEEYLLRPQPPEAPDSPYFSAAAIAARGRDAAAALGDDPVTAVQAASEAAIALVGRTPPDASVGSPLGTMPLSRYLPSRIAELTIHGLDIGRAVGADLIPPPAALRESLAFTAVIAAIRRGPEAGVTALLALSGRGPLPEGFSVY
jgi:uncharacterized protein (TIGR03083 family)